MSHKELKAEVLSRIDERRSEITRLCSQLLRIPTENPPGDTKTFARFVDEFLQERGFDRFLYEPKKGIWNLISSIGKSVPGLVLNAHMDTFPAGTGWGDDPFSGDVREGNILGRGAVDMKGGLTASLFAFVTIGEIVEGHPGAISLCLVSDEESGGEWGTNWILENTLIQEAKACLIGEPGGIDVLGIGEKGRCCFSVQTRGKAAHGAYDTLGENAIVKMCRAVPVIEGLRSLQGRAPIELVELIEKEKPYVESFYGNGTSDVLTRVSVNIGKIEGGGVINLVPDSCEVQVDTRLPIPVSPEEVLKTLQEKLRETDLDDVQITPISTIEPTFTSPGERIVEVVCKNVKEIVEIDPLCLIKIGATDSRFFRKRNIPTITYGPGIYRMGMPGEYIPIEELIKITKVHAAVAIDYLFKGD